MTKSTRDFFKAQYETMNQNRLSSKRIATIGDLAFVIRDAASPIASAATNDPHLNDAGKRAAKQTALRESFVEVARSRAELRRLGEAARAELKALALPAIERGDIVAEMREAEMRAIVRTMPQEQRDRPSKLSPAMVAAIVRAAPELSGISPSVHEMLHSQLIETAHPEKVAAIRSELEGLQFAELAIKETDKILTEAASFAPGEEQPYREQVAVQTDKPADPPQPDPNDLDEMIAAHRRRHKLPPLREG